MRKLILFLLMASAAISAYTQKRDFKVIGYYAGSAERLAEYDIGKLTHIIHCFSHLRGNQLDPGRPASIAVLEKMVRFKKDYPHLKVLLSLGGWTGCFTCSEVFSDASNRLAFARSVKDVLEKYGADGIDLDWEYPAVEGPPGHPYKPEDRENFTLLISQLRKTLGKKYIISFAAGGFDKYFKDAVEWKKVSKLVNFINLMSYDLVNGYSKVTGHHTPLYATAQNPFSVDYGVNEMINRGVPAKKIIIGLAFYGRIWENVPDVHEGLYQSGKFKAAQSIVKIDELRKEDGYAFNWDDTAKAPYIYNKALGLFYTYDDKRSVGLKTEYALDKNLGGLMFWQLGEDYPREGLLDEIDRVLKDRR